MDAVGASPDGRGYADLLEAAAIGAGQLDFAVAPTLEHRLIALRDRAKKLAITASSASADSESQAQRGSARPTSRIGAACAPTRHTVPGKPWQIIAFLLGNDGSFW